MLSQLAHAAKESGRSTLSLIQEAVRLRYAKGRVGISEYMDFRLYLNDLTFEQKTAFGGWRAQAILEHVVVDDSSRFLSLDKITMYSLLRGYELPIPAARAVYGSPRPQFLLNLRTPEELADYLQAPGILPVFFKPSHGSYGRGNILVCDAQNGRLVLGDGSTVDVIEFCRGLDDGKTLGWILQEPLTSHSDIAARCGQKISGLRVHSFLAPDGVKLLKAIFKINVGKEDSDNFRHGVSGNMLAAVDLESGIVTRVIAGIRHKQLLNPVHPISGQQLVGFELPHWQEIKSITHEAQLAFPGFLCPGWDIAICDDGPKILEVNFFGDMDLSQQAYRIGFLDEEFMALMRARGLDHYLEHGRKPRSSRSGHRLDRHWPWG